MVEDVPSSSERSVNRRSTCRVPLDLGSSNELD